MNGFKAGLKYLLFVCVTCALLPMIAAYADEADGAVAVPSDTQPVFMCVDPDWWPFETIDERGAHVGIAADLVALAT